MDTNVLYYGDNLEILRKYIPDNSVDLVYLDPPFNSKATYNVLYKEQTGEPSQAQITAFEDTWHWGLESERALEEIFASPIVSPAVVGVNHSATLLFALFVHVFSLKLAGGIIGLEGG